MEKLDQLLNRHNSLRNQVHDMEDEQYKLLYTHVGDALLSTKNPGMWQLYRLTRMVRSFEKAIKHRQAEHRCSLRSDKGFQA